MDQFPQLGRVLVILGLVIIVLGVLLIFANRISWIGKLPGDISFTRGKFSFYFPIVTCIILSIILTVLFNLFGRGR